MSFSPETNRNKATNPEFQKPIEKLRAALALMAKKINAEILEKHGLKNLLLSDGSIYQMEYRQLHGDKKILEDLEEVKRREISFSGANDPDVLESLALSVDGRVKMWKKNKQESLSGQMEMAMTLLLHKFLKDKFLIVRTVDIDDYNGVDNLVINLKSGEVVGAFDDVNQDVDGERLADKINKIKAIGTQGGAHIDYGLSLEQGQLKRSKVENLPVFYLGLFNHQLRELLAQMDYNLDSEPNETEQKIFKQLIESLTEQRTMLLAEAEKIRDLDVKNKFMEKLRAFETTLEIMLAEVKTEFKNLAA